MLELIKNITYEPELNNTIVGDENSELIEMNFKKFCDELIRELNNLYDLFEFIDHNDVTIYELYEKIDPNGYNIIKEKCPYYLDIIVISSEIHNPNLKLNRVNTDYKDKFKNINGIWKHCLAFVLDNDYFNDIIYNNHQMSNITINVDRNINEFTLKLCDIQNKLDNVTCYKLQNNIPIKYTKLPLEEINEFDDETIDKMGDVILSHYKTYSYRI